ncbi:hypothetical protein [Paraburkholderia saeva]|uniref:hypothetical protein n=1 Tax=Paraburkholderia saeva TaxID=2777537 RepID=UPI001D2C2BF8|nr:hypothetical protein [Paraburkholderia saeva]CAG4903081.1 hypothetical protein R52603_03039 [Paraburkholderia saeva]
MKLDWRLHERKELESGKPPSAWIAVAITVLAFIIGFAVTVLTWQKGQPVVSAPFAIRALLVPLLVSGFLCALLYTGHEDWTDTVDVWNFLCARGRVRWQAWSQGCVAILESVTFTPEKDLAERMLGLEGSEPRNEGKLLPLSADRESDAGQESYDVALSGSRLDATLEKLLMPFVPFMARFAARHSFVAILQSEDEDGISAVRAVLRKLDLPDADRIGVERAEGQIDAALIHRWLNEGKMPDFCLLLACQLHQEGQDVRYSEVAVGMLLATEDFIRRYPREFKPQAYVFQPVSAAPESVTHALRDMLKAQRMPPEYVRHLWLSSLPKQARHAAEAASEAAALKAAAHDVDLAIGKPGPAGALLAQALAAEMVQHGQGTQLVATSGGAGILLNLTGTQEVPAPVEHEYELRYLRPLRIVAYACMCGLAGIFLGVTEAPGGLFLLVPFVLVALVLMEALGAQGRYEEVEAMYHGRSE